MNILNLIPYVYERFELFILVFSRISSLLISFMLFRSDFVSPKIIISLSTLLAIIVLLAHPNLTMSYDILSGKAILVVMTQMLMGFIGGLILNILFEIFSCAGQIISTQIGLSLASLIDPKLGSITSLTRFYNYIIIIVFLLLNGHLLAIKTLLLTFDTIPVNTASISISSFGDILDYSSVIFSSGMMFAITVVISVMLANFSLAMLSRFAPQFNLYSIGVNLSLILGIICIYLTFNLFITQAGNSVNDGLSFLAKALANLATVSAYGR